MALPDRWHAGLVIASLVVGGVAAVLALWYQTDAHVLVVAAWVVIGAAVITASQVSRTQGWLDIFHPLLFPSLYTGFTFLVPTWVLLVRHDSLGYPADTPLAINTAFLMAAAAAVFALGCLTSRLFPSHRRSHDHRVSPARLRKTAWMLLLVSFAVALSDLHSKVVYTRALNQTTYDLYDHIGTLAAMTAPIAVMLLMAGQSVAGHRQLLRRIDWLAIATLLAVLGMNGRRATALAVLLLIFYQWSQRTRRGSLALLGILTVAILAYVVVNYRSALLGEQSHGFFYDTVRDVSPATFTTGATAAVIPSAIPFLGGSTYLAGLLRQIPGPLANWIFGPPDDTGNFAFRRVIGYDNPNHGFGFSLPAEGYMNFGLIGLIAACSLVGVFLAWSYRQRGDSSRPIHLLYPLLIATLPFGLRSDFLSLLKGILYPMLIISFAYLIARTKSGAAGNSSKPGSRYRLTVAASEWRSRLKIHR